MNSESTPSNIDHIPLEYFKNLDSNWDAELKSIPDIQQLNNSVQRRDEFEKYAIAAQNEILRLKEVAKYYVNLYNVNKYKDRKRNNSMDFNNFYHKTIENTDMKYSLKLDDIYNVYITIYPYLCKGNKNSKPMSLEEFKSCLNDKWKPNNDVYEGIKFNSSSSDIIEAVYEDLKVKIILVNHFREFINDRIEYDPKYSSGLTMAQMYDFYRIWFFQNCADVRKIRPRKDLQLYMDYKFGKYVSNRILSKDKGYKGLKEKPYPYIGGSDLNIQTESDDLDN
tara:strand:- start:1457 stop:2296 length:840 start_codon:yes stop_codon:yes gene_type:complete